jgi:hypothetical protein
VFAGTAAESWWAKKKPFSSRPNGPFDRDFQAGPSEHSTTAVAGTTGRFASAGRLSCPTGGRSKPSPNLPEPEYGRYDPQSRSVRYNRRNSLKSQRGGDRSNSTEALFRGEVVINRAAEARPQGGTCHKGHALTVSAYVSP